MNKLIVLLILIKVLTGGDCHHEENRSEEALSILETRSQSEPLPILETRRPQSEPLPVIEIEKDTRPVIKVTKPQVQYVPYQVALLENGTRYCAGAIIHERFIATTAYCCLIANIKKAQVSIGDANNQEIHDIHSFFIHGKYDLRQKNYDICLIKLRRPLRWSTKVQRIVLPIRPLPELAPVIIYGWGQNFDLVTRQRYIDDLKEIQAYHIERLQCQRRFTETLITDHMLCIGDYFNDKGTCGLDNGDPLIVSGILYGLASWNLNCDPMRMTQPLIFTNVFNLKHFILEIIRKHNYN